MRMQSAFSLCLILCLHGAVVPQSHSADDAPIGWAAVNAKGQNGVTGGAGGTIVTVDNQADLRRYCDEDGPYVIQVQGTITMTNQIPVLSDKTVIGLGTDAEIVGRAFLIEGDSNIILRNLTIRGSTSDGITIEDAGHHIWIDHCTIIDSADGAIDIGRGSDYVTVSYCKFFYTVNSGHNFVNLIGSSDSHEGTDAGALKVTFHHNWWSTLCIERMPRVRFGQVHCFNNFFDATGNNYCIRAGRDSQIFSERNYFKAVDEPFEYFITIGTAGRIRDVESVLDNCTNVYPAVDDIDDIFTPHYEWSAHVASAVPDCVTATAGAETELAVCAVEPPQPETAVSAANWQILDH